MPDSQTQKLPAEIQNGATQNGATQNGATPLRSPDKMDARGSVAPVGVGETDATPQNLLSALENLNNGGSSKALDLQRARQILDRAFLMSERGDFAGAIVACRQSIALVPDEAASHSMLGFLLERSGDFKGAMASYEKTLQIAPDSPLERDSLRRLLTQHSEQSTARFQFDENELFADAQDKSAKNEVENAAPSSVESSSIKGVSPQIVQTHNTANASITATSSTRSASMISSDATLDVPATTAKVLTPNATAPNATAPNTKILKNAVVRSARVDWMAALRAYPNFWTRSLPLLAVAGSGFLAMLLTHNYAPRTNAPISNVQTVIEESAPLGGDFDAARDTAAGANANANAVAPDPTTAGNSVAPSNGINATGAPMTGAPTTGAPNVNAPSAPAPNVAPSSSATPDANGLFSSSWTITNRPQASPPNAAPRRDGVDTNNGVSANNNASDNRERRATSSTRSGVRSDSRNSSTRNSDSRNNGARNSSTRSADNRRAISPSNDPRAPMSLPPAAPSTFAPVPPASVPALPSTPNQSPSQNSRASDDPQFPPGSNDGNNDDGGNGGIQPFKGELPQFPNPTTNSQPSMRSSSVLSSSNNRHAENAYRYQTRALLYLERGENAKSKADFESAIGFYRRQIASGIGVADAQRGIEACRNGLAMVSGR